VKIDGGAASARGGHSEADGQCQRGGDERADHERILQPRKGSSGGTNPRFQRDAQPAEEMKSTFDPCVLTWRVSIVIFIP
jgi:hypothetical protein